MSNEIDIDREELAENIRAFDRFMSITSGRDIGGCSGGVSPTALGPYDPPEVVISDVLLDSLAAAGLKDVTVWPDSAAAAEAAAAEVQQHQQLVDQMIQKQCKDRHIVRRVTSVPRRIINVIKSDVGLLVILLNYSFLGAFVFHYLEYDRDLEINSEMANMRRSVAVDILNNVTAKVRRDDLSFVGNGSDVIFADDVITNDTLQAIETFLDVFGVEKEKLKPSSKSPGWSYWGALFFCGTVFTTVGYGQIVPVTSEGRIATMIYAAVGIPLCLVVLASLGKSLTKAIKHLWSFIRRFYYTGSCRRVRHVIPLRKLRMSCVERLTDRLRRRTLRRKTRQAGNADDPVAAAAAEAELRYLKQMDETAIVQYEVDDKFNLPPIIALVVAFVYILLGALLYTQWEEWTYLEAFYFTFISLCTIGFGDIVPKHPKFFLLTSVYLLFGLALIAMVVNVVMETVNDTIARAKNRVYTVGRRIADVAHRQSAHTLEQASTIRQLVRAGRPFHQHVRRCSV